MSSKLTTNRYGLGVRSSPGMYFIGLSHCWSRSHAQSVALQQWVCFALSMGLFSPLFDVFLLMLSRLLARDPGFSDLFLPSFVFPPDIGFNFLTCLFWYRWFWISSPHNETIPASPFSIILMLSLCSSMEFWTSFPNFSKFNYSIFENEMGGKKNFSIFKSEKMKVRENARRRWMPDRTKNNLVRLLNALANNFPISKLMDMAQIWPMSWKAFC